MIKVEKSTQLPLACFSHLFNETKIIYKGKLVKADIMVNPKNQLVSGIQIGDYLYLKQELFEDSAWAKLSRRGHKVLWIVHRPTAKVVGRVIDGKVHRIVTNGQI